MHLFKVFSIFLFAVTALGCSDKPNATRITPVSENACNVSCGFDHEKNKACFEKPVVTNYATGDLLPELISTIGPILEEQPPGACFCGFAILNESGKFVSVTISEISDASMGDDIREIVLNGSAVPIPPEAECIVGVEFPLSFNN